MQYGGVQEIPPGIASPRYEGTKTSESMWRGFEHRRHTWCCSLGTLIGTAVARFPLFLVRAERRVALVLRRPLNVIDHENIDGTFGRFQSKAKLFLNRGEDRRPCRVRIPGQCLPTELRTEII